MPTSIHNGKLYFLFGKENKYADTPGWSDFGGGTDNNESHLQTAIREGGEEMTGFLGSDPELRKMLKTRGTYNIDGERKYRMHIFSYDYNPSLPFYYNNNQKFLQTKLDPKIIETSKIFEKEEIRWVCIDDLPKMRSEFRSYFQNTVDKILQQQKRIYDFISEVMKKAPKVTGKIVKKSKSKTIKREKKRRAKTLRKQYK